MKKYLSIIIVFILSLTATETVYAQNLQDVIQLKNGTIIKGTLIEQVPNVKIRTNDGNVLTLDSDQIIAITSEPKEQNNTNFSNFYSDNNLAYNNSAPTINKKSKPEYKPLAGGFRLLGDISLQYAKDDYCCDIFSVGISAGIQLTQNIYLGVGFADQIYMDYWYYGYYDCVPTPVAVLPFFVDGRYDFRPNKISPFVQCRFGYSLCIDPLADYSGMLISPSIGLRINKFSIHFGIETVKLKDPWVLIQFTDNGYQETSMDKQTTLQIKFMFEVGGRKNKQ